MSYVLKKDKSGGFMFNLKAGNGEIILTSESYVQKASAEGGIASVRKHGTDAKNFELKTASSGSPYFVLQASNGQALGRSEMYSSTAAAQNGIASVQKNCVSTQVSDQTGAP